MAVLQKGKIVQWNDERGFGFIQLIGSTQQFFFHVSGMAHRERPSLHRIVFFKVIDGQDGRQQAVDIQYSQPLKTHKKREANQSLTPKGFISIAYISLLLIFVLIDKLSIWVVLWIVCASSITYFAYYDDKQRAQYGRWRIPEDQLHFFALLGGWSGALLAQQVLRHKSKKKEFLRVFWLTVLVNLIVVGLLIRFGFQGFISAFLGVFTDS